MTDTYDFVIVGSGAGGGPLAANLALEGFDVALIEAGGEEINDNYAVPAFHALATEDPAYSWQFFVDHYSPDNDPQRDPKYHPDDSHPGAPGIFYPRAAGLGGCTTHHAMITVYPHESDWNNIAEIVGHDSWRAENMRQYFDRIEQAQYRDASVLLDILESLDSLLHPTHLIGRLWRRFTASEGGEGARRVHGAGWLPVSQADPTLLLQDFDLLKIVKQAFVTAKKHNLGPMPGLDPNNPGVVKEDRSGVNVIPISVDNGRRKGAREHVLRAQKIVQRGQGRLDIKTHTLATKVLFDDSDPLRAIGAECAVGRHLYAAHPDRGEATDPAHETARFMASKEVILCGGAFNTPQLLMLSGIGPASHLEQMGIQVRLPLPGVGQNLQDRYEVGVVAKAPRDFDLLAEASFGLGGADPTLDEWRDDRNGIYATNGALLGVIMRSTTRGADDPPDLYIFGVPGYFRGYEVGFSEKAVRIKDHFTWAVLKGHTDNVSGSVTLKSSNPFDTPDIHFRYFEESNESDEKDVQSVVDGVEFVMEMYDQLIDDGLIEKVVVPADRNDLHGFVRDNAWGHHASCTCRIGGEDDENAVLDGNFKVRGTENLRVVDASVFPRVPGLFILASVYMISEKASDVIIADHRQAHATVSPTPSLTVEG